ncbi:hypothetical protein [Rhodanobacter sp. Soil772]|nr:hypothetical protein [Rhodanobacter sp. Soil772]
MSTGHTSTRPRTLALSTDPDPEKVRQVTAALMPMKKIGVKTLQRAAG